MHLHKWTVSPPIEILTLNRVASPQAEQPANLSCVKQYDTNTNSRLMIQTINAVLKASGPRDAFG